MMRVGVQEGKYGSQAHPAPLKERVVILQWLPTVWPGQTHLGMNL